MNPNGILIGSEDPQRLTAYYTRLFGEPGVQGTNPQPGRLSWNLETPDGRRPQPGREATPPALPPQGRG